MDQTEKFVILGRMSAMLAHEIRNPLAGISAVTQVLEGKIEKEDPRKKYVNLIMKEIDRVNCIVHDLLDYTRDSRSYFVRADIVDLLDNALDPNSEDIEKKSIRVEKEFSIEKCEITIDKDKVDHALKNVVTNAIEAMENGGALTLKVGHIENSRKNNPLVEISVSDTGKGSDLEDLSEMFSPFYTTKTKGTGLGLAVAQKVIEEHSGRIYAERNHPEGLTFRIMLPLEQQDKDSNPN